MGTASPSHDVMPHTVRIAWTDNCDGQEIAYADGERLRKCKSQPETTKKKSANGLRHIATVVPLAVSPRPEADVVDEADPLHPSMRVTYNPFGGVCAPRPVSTFTKPQRKVSVKNVYLAANSKDCGKGKALAVIEQVRAIFTEASIHVDIVETQSPGRYFDLARDCSFDDYDVLCVLGGDACLHQAVNGMLSRADGRRVPIGMIPIGNSVSIADDLGQPSLAEAALRVVGGMTHSVDVARVSFRGATTYAVGAVAWPANYLSRSVGGAMYFEVLRGKMGRKVRMDIDGETVEDSAMLVQVQNTQHTARGVRAAPMARADDGLLDLVLVRSMGRTAFASLLGSAPDGTWVFHDRVEYRRFRRLTLRATDAPSAAVIDGIAAQAEPMTIEVVPGALELFGAELCDSM